MNDMYVCSICGADADGTLLEVDTDAIVCRNCYETLSEAQAYTDPGVHQEDNEADYSPIDIVR